MKVLCEDLKKEISQYSSKIAHSVGEDGIYTELTSHLSLRFYKNRHYFDIYHKNNAYLIVPCDTVDPHYKEKEFMTDMPLAYIQQWKSCHLRYMDTLFLLSTHTEDTNDLLLLFNALDVPLQLKYHFKKNLLYQCDYDYSYESKSYILYLVEHHYKHTALQVQYGDPLYHFIEKKYYQQKTIQARFLLSVLVMSFIYLIGIRRLSIYATGPACDCILELMISSWITMIVYLKLK